MGDPSPRCARRAEPRQCCESALDAFTLPVPLRRLRRVVVATVAASTVSTRRACQRCGSSARQPGNERPRPRLQRHALRLRLLKIGAVVTRNTRTVTVRLSSASAQRRRRRGPRAHRTRDVRHGARAHESAAMIRPARQGVEVWLCVEPVDFRKSASIQASRKRLRRVNSNRNRSVGPRTAWIVPVIANRPHTSLHSSIRRLDSRYPPSFARPRKACPFANPIPDCCKKFGDLL